LFVHLLQVIDQRPLASGGKMISSLHQADFTASMVIVDADEFASFALLNGHSRGDGNAHACRHHGQNAGELATLKYDAGIQIGSLTS
jgi:hypothetical protein